MDDAFAGHPVDERDGLLQGVPGACEIVAVDRRADAAQRPPQTGTELTVMFTILDTLPMRLERGCMLGHVI